MTTSDSRTKKVLDKLSSISFLLGLLSSKIDLLPITIATPLFNLISLSLYLSGYALWFAASQFYPDIDPKYRQWFGFAPFKDQNQYAAFLGIGASLIALSAIAIPTLAIPAAWMFFSSNLIWVIGEYHKLKNPPLHEKYSESYQKSYLSYALSMTAMGLTGALSATLVSLFPLSTIPIMLTSVLMSLGLGVTGVTYWFDYTYGNHPTSTLPQSNDSSYDMMGSKLEFAIPMDSESPSPKPYHGKDRLFATVEDMEQELSPSPSWFSAPCINP